MVFRRTKREVEEIFTLPVTWGGMKKKFTTMVDFSIVEPLVTYNAILGNLFLTPSKWLYLLTM